MYLKIILSIYVTIVLRRLNFSIFQISAIHLHYFSNEEKYHQVMILIETININNAIYKYSKLDHNKTHFILFFKMN